MNPDEMIAILQAYKEGKEIEFLDMKNPDEGWHPIPGMKWNFSLDRWNFARHKYRIKPDQRKPREWVIYEAYGRFLAYEPETSVLHAPDGSSVRIVCRAREVLE